MMKKILTTSLVVTTLLLSGCGSDSEGESRLETQQMLDNANYDGVISKLSSSYLTQEDNLALAAAYMGRAGLSLADLIKVVGDSSNTQGDAFGSFIGSVADATTGSVLPLTDINKATQYYTNVVGNICNEEGVVLTDSQKDICLFKGLTQTMGAATTMNYIASDIGSVFDTTSNAKDEKLNASTCAMQYAINGSEGDCTIVDNNIQLTFPNGKTYSEIEVTSSTETYNYLLTQTTPRSTAITNGYCSTDDFTTRTESKEDGYHVCPVQEENTSEEITTGSVIADALNNGIDSVGVAADDTMKDDINEFKSNVLADSGKTANDTITEEDIVNYLNKNNN